MFFLSLWRPKVPIFSPSIKICPSGSVRRNKQEIRDDLPAPVRPTIPICGNIMQILLSIRLPNKWNACSISVNFRFVFSISHKIYYKSSLTFSPEDMEKLSCLRTGGAFWSYLRDTSEKTMEPVSGHEGFKDWSEITKQKQFCWTWKRSYINCIHLYQKYL